MKKILFFSMKAMAAFALSFVFGMILFLLTNNPDSFIPATIFGGLFLMTVFNCFD